MKSVISHWGMSRLIKRPNSIVYSSVQADTGVHETKIIHRQSRIGSFFESAMNILVGFVISFILNYFVLHGYGHKVTVSENLQIVMIFTAASFARQYVIRRYFNKRPI